MSKKLFTEDEIKILSKNKFVKKVSSKGITYSDDFKRLFISENEKGKLPRQIFKESGFDINILGIERVKSSAKRWRAAFRKNGVTQLQDNRKFNTGSLLKEIYLLKKNMKNYKLKLNC